MKTYLRLAVFYAALCISSVLEGQITLFDNINTAPADCETGVLGESVDIVIGNMCGPNFAIIFPDMTSVIVENDTTIVLDQLGQYDFVCNTVAARDPNLDLRVFTAAGCLVVTETAIPTMGEWGVFILILLIFIAATVVLREREDIIPEFYR